ncbi:kelch repeat-containing protein, partial [Schnuerera sp.]|uniref:Kelch repeat-containing protein n=1 Tax=Schnuerera sp. TaxID=2794844 RepID=UPI002C60A8A5
MNNQKGSILISLLLIIIVLSILSIGVYRLSYSASRQAQFSRDNSQAYYLTKVGADLVINNIEKVIREINDGDKKDFEIEFPNEGKSIISVEANNDNKKIILSSTGIVNENKRYESKSSIKAMLTFSSNFGEVLILGVDKDGVIYEFDKDFENPRKLEIKDENGNEIIISDPRAFAWDGGDTLVLVGGESGKGNNKDDTLIYKFSTDESKSLKTGGNGFRYVVYSEEEDKFYAINTNNDKINYLDSTEWKDIHKPKAGFKVDRLAQGNNTIVGISKNKPSQVTYYKEPSNKWESKVLKGYDLEGIYNAISYGESNDSNGVFVIVGNEENNSNPIFMYSENGVDWYKAIQQNSMMGINYELNDLVWTGKKFVAVGNSGTIYTSNDGKDWYVFDRKEIIKGEGAPLDYWFNYSKVSGYGDYII